MYLSKSECDAGDLEATSTPTAPRRISHAIIEVPEKAMMLPVTVAV